jgi:hypothetical protein
MLLCLHSIYIHKLIFILYRGYICYIALYGAETWTLLKVYQKYLERFEMWCCRRLERISWTDHVRNEEVLNDTTVEESSGYNIDGSC